MNLEKLNVEDIRCPKCGGKSTYTINQSMNTLNVNAPSAICFDHVCKDCGKDFISFFEVEIEITKSISFRTGHFEGSTFHWKKL